MGAMEQWPTRSYRITRADLVAYAQASGDPNPIHQDPEVARSVGLPDVIAHGMYTLALAARYVDEQLGEAGRIAELGAKFTRPVVVPEEGTEVEISGAWRDDHTIALTVVCDGRTVLGNPVAVLGG
ncbi:MaoC/PaaZ C-terminal domain-containing protein [Nocardioides terrisoli]|uniref:MaoC/PaaZ C-terminal domain-containing protein n=1 Tax=Nocardioides terrisoli TaxID=3388267 RepID=UPI00287B6464|nr:MaoC/PaaZ C-terminal domain-containing protein [Nocardioides marmorisolisilvae]